MNPPGVSDNFPLGTRNMADAAEMAGFEQPQQSLSQTFNNLNKLRHTIMDFSMLFMAIGAVVAGAGPLVGILDPITPFIKMHFQGWLMAPDVLADFVPNALDNLSTGTLLSGIDPVSLHDMAGGAIGGADTLGHAAHLGLDAQNAQFADWVNGMSPEQLSEISAEAKDVYGMSLSEYHRSNFLDHSAPLGGQP